MLGSQALEVLVDLALVPFVVVRGIDGRRVDMAHAQQGAKDLEGGLGSMLGDPEVIYETSLLMSLSNGAGKRWFGQGNQQRTSCVYAKSFADAVADYLIASCNVNGPAPADVSTLVLEHSLGCSLKRASRDTGRSSAADGHRGLRRAQ